MPRARILHAAVALTMAVLAVPASGRAVLPSDLASYVDPMVGTLGAGFVFPGPDAPYGMVQVSPDTDGYFAYTGYQYADQAIRGFSHVHVESMGVQEGGDVPFMPTVGPIASTDPAVFKSTFTHAAEHAEAGYYAVTLDNGVTTELTAGERIGAQRYTFPPASQANVILDVGHSVWGMGVSPDGGVAPGTHPATISIVDDRTVTGSVTEGKYVVYFASRFSRPFSSAVTWNAANGAPAAAASATGVGAGGAVTFDATLDRTVTVVTGISFARASNAMLNLETELGATGFGASTQAFDAIRASTRAAWNDALGAIDVDGGTPVDRRAFYTAFYHAQQHPNIFNDVNGEYMGNDHVVHLAQGFTYYTNFSLWDTYRHENQLLALVQPARFRDMMHSMLVVAQDGGRLPRWNLMNDYADYMNGEPSIPAIVDGYCRGLVPPDDVAPLYAKMLSFATDPTKHRDPAYLQYGYIPGNPSSTQEHAIADFALALMANKLGATADRDHLLVLAKSWEHMFNPATKFVQPRDANGNYSASYRPEFPDGYREGTGWQYLWLEPHDVARLRSLLDTPDAPTTFTDRLDSFFSEAIAEAAPGPVAEAQSRASLYSVTWYGNQYTPGNETDLQSPYYYDYAGQPWKSQAIIRGLQQLYRPAPDGLPGNDDLGSMSAWYVWSALGFSPVTTGAPLYAIGSPVFETARIRVPGGTFTVHAPGASLAGRYVQSAALNDAPLAKTWFTHDKLVPGGSLTLAMDVTANHAWGSAPDAAPPSQSTDPLASFGC